MIKENNDIFVAGSDALIYLAGPKSKNYFTTFAWGNPFSTFVFYDQFISLPPCKHMYPFRLTRLLYMSFH